MIEVLVNNGLLLLRYEADLSRDAEWVDEKLNTDGYVTFRRTFTFEPGDIFPGLNQDQVENDTRHFTLGVTDKDYFKIKKHILGLKHDLLISREINIRTELFIAHRDISIINRIDDLIDEQIVIGGNAENSIPTSEFEELLRNFPTSTELTHYARSRISLALKDYLGTMSDAQINLDRYLNKKKTIKNRSKIEFVKDYEPIKFEYVRNEIIAMLSEVDVSPDSIKEADWQRQIVEFLLLIFPKYIAVLENVHIKDFYSNPSKATNRYLDLLLVDANGSVDIIEVKRPHPHQLLSRKPGSRGNYMPSSELSEAIMQAEKYLYHMNKWGQAGEREIQEKRKTELPNGFNIKITNPKAMLVLGRDNSFDDRQKFDFEIIKRKYANIVDIITYDDLLRRLDNIISMINHNYSKLGSKVKPA